LKYYKHGVVAEGFILIYYVSWMYLRYLIKKTLLILSEVKHTYSGLLTISVLVIVLNSVGIRVG